MTKPDPKVVRKIAEDAMRGAIRDGMFWHVNQAVIEHGVPGPIFKGSTFEVHRIAAIAEYKRMADGLSWPGEQPQCGRSRVVCLCGSTRFREQFDATNLELTLAGRIVLAPGVFGRNADGFEISAEEKAALDALHLAKIDLADEVYVINPGGYIGESTANEIAYATAHGKPVSYLEER